MVTAKRVAFVVAGDFDDTEFEVSYGAFEAAGAEVTIVGLATNEHLCGHHNRICVTTDKSFDEVSADDFDAQVIPGGYSPDKLRIDDRAVRFVKSFVESGKPVGAICHGPQLLITAGVVDGKTVTGWPSIAIDLKNAGANFIDSAVVVDGNIVTSRNPGDARAFSEKLIDMLGLGKAAA